MEASEQNRVDRGHRSGNQGKHTGNIEMPHHRTCRARTEQVVHGAHREQEHGSNGHDPETEAPPPTPSSPSNQKVADDSEDGCRQKMGPATHWFPEAWNGNCIDVVHSLLFAVVTSGNKVRRGNDVVDLPRPTNTLGNSEV